MHIIHSTPWLNSSAKWLKARMHVIKNMSDYKNRAVVLELPHVAYLKRTDSEAMFLYFWFSECNKYFSQYLIPIGMGKSALSPSEWAVFKLDCEYQDYFDHRIKSAERALIRKAIKNGFTVRKISYDEYLKEILEINRSKSERGGRPMSEDYLNAQKWEEVVRPINPDIYTFGCFNAEGKLVAYYLFEKITNFFHTAKGIAHNDVLNFGVMNYLFAYSVSELSSIKKCPYLIYGPMDKDSKSGLNGFKRHVGCESLPMVLQGTKDDYRNLDFFNKHYHLHGDSTLNYIKEYIIQNKK